jgi:hypothetical protein
MPITMPYAAKIPTPTTDTAVKVITKTTNKLPKFDPLSPSIAAGIPLAGLFCGPAECFLNLPALTLAAVSK